MIEVNDRRYHPRKKTIVGICIDGCADEYLSTSLDQGRMPHVAPMIASGYRGMARGALPSFTNVNNASIVTGMPPSVTGISGNFFLDPQTGQQVMMNSARYLRCETLLAAVAITSAAAAWLRTDGPHGTRWTRHPRSWGPGRSERGPLGCRAP